MRTDELGRRALYISMQSLRAFGVVIRKLRFIEKI